jgi:hypothetical protein
MRRTDREWFIFTTDVEGDIEMKPIPDASFAETRLEEWKKEHPGVDAYLKRTDPPRGRLVPRRGRPKHNTSKSRGR